MPERDYDLVEHILRYCSQIETAHMDFNRSEAVFRSSTTYQNAISMCILQIGELVNHLSDCIHKRRVMVIRWLLHPFSSI